MKINKNRVYLDLPEFPEHKVTISPELKKQLQDERLKQFDRLKVFAIGEEVKYTTVGSEVFVDPNALRAGVIFKIGEKDKISVSEDNIMHTW